MKLASYLRVNKTPKTRMIMHNTDMKINFFMAITSKKRQISVVCLKLPFLLSKGKLSVRRQLPCTCRISPLIQTETMQNWGRQSEPIFGC